MTDEVAPESWSPGADPAAVAAVADAIAAAGVEIRRDQPLAPLTTLGVGGAAAVMVEPADPGQLAVVLAAVARHDEAAVPLLVVGKGSNLLVADSGWPAVALRLGSGFKWMTRDGDLVSSGAATAMPALAAWTATEQLTGLEFAAGIPASVGGSVRMNAGAHGGETADHLLDIELASPAVPTGERRAVESLAFGYRRSGLPSRAVVTAARWRLQPDGAAEIRRRLDELRAWRRSTQPLRQRNCGSVFSNPRDDSAGRLVDAAGLKGLRRGGAQISSKHANFIVVDPGATRAADVRALIAEVRRRVRDGGGPLLEPEVRLVGDFGDVPEVSA